MRSELWQRLRAVRRYADIRQTDVAKACGVSRGAVAQWEAIRPDYRTAPSIEQISIISKLTRVPVDWLMDNEVEPESIWEFGKNYGIARSAPPVFSRVVEQAPPPAGRLLDSFKSAVEFAVVSMRPELEDAFGQVVDGVKIDYHYQTDLAKFGLASGAWREHVSGLLLREKLFHLPQHKMLILWSSDIEQDEDRIDREYCWETFDVMAHVVKSPEQAASVLLQSLR